MPPSTPRQVLCQNMEDIPYTYKSPGLQLLEHRIHTSTFIYGPRRTLHQSVHVVAKMTHYSRGHQTQAHLMEDFLPGSGRRGLKSTATVHRDDLYQDEPSDQTPSYFRALRDQILHVLFPDNAFTRKLRTFWETSGEGRSSFGALSPGFRLSST